MPCHFTCEEPAALRRFITLQNVVALVVIGKKKSPGMDVANHLLKPRAALV